MQQRRQAAGAAWPASTFGVSPWLVAPSVACLPCCAAAVMLCTTLRLALPRCARRLCPMPPVAPLPAPTLTLAQAAADEAAAQRSAAEARAKELEQQLQEERERLERLQVRSAAAGKACAQPGICSQLHRHCLQWHIKHAAACVSMQPSTGAGQPQGHEPEEAFVGPHSPLSVASCMPSGLPASCCRSGPAARR